jgi:5-methylcytosine-specific restriction endonuclease McrA
MNASKKRGRKERNFRKHLELRKNLFHAQGGVCFFCEKPFSLTSPATIEHLVPKSMGGSGRFDNLALTHENCNHKRQCHGWLAYVTFALNPAIRKNWKRFIITGYLPRIHRLSSMNSV